MLNVKFLEEIIPNIDKWTYGDLKKIELMEEKDIIDIVERWSNYNHENKFSSITNINDLFRLCITALYYMKHTKTISISKDSIKINTTEWERLINKPLKHKDYSLIKHKEDSIKKSEKILTKRQSELKCDMYYYDDQINSGECHACIKGNRDNFVPKSL